MNAITLVKVKELMENWNDPKKVPNHDFYINEVKKEPKELEIFGKVIEGPIRGWDEEAFGPFPKEGVLIIYSKLPSSNHSLKSK